jgi:deoxyribodipyrimidine photo-lyase
MADNARRCAAAGVDYLPYVEPSPGAGSGLLAALAREACLVVTDDYPCFFLPRMVSRAAERLDVALEAVDANGLLPLADADTAFPSAYAFRRHLQKRLPLHLRDFPEADPLAHSRLRRERAIPATILDRWPAARLDAADEILARLPIDHGVAPVEGMAGGAEAASGKLEEFLDGKLSRYADEHGDVQHDVTSRLSPYLHFGHLSIHELMLAVASREAWTPAQLGSGGSGRRSGWWGMSAGAEAFLDEAVTWRELSFNFCARRSDYDRFDSLPAWARETLVSHAADPRSPVYALEDLAEARTHDPLWNAAQTQLRREGRIHNYLRMLWGKKILEWTPTPEVALETMIELNNRYALDGRDPNSYSGIFWVLGRFDRPWGPERPIFGLIRYMSSENTARKMNVKGYVQRFATPALF